MSDWKFRWTLGVLFACALLGNAPAHEESDESRPAPSHAASGGPARSTPGRNAWNQGEEPRDWWKEIVRYHGHVGPWNVMGWRIGRAARRELGAQWGDHSLNIICHLPLATPYTCLADGLTVATGNSIGRLDIRLAEELTTATMHVSIQAKSGGQVLDFWPNSHYMKEIEKRPFGELEALSHRSAEMEEQKLFTLVRH